MAKVGIGNYSIIPEEGENTERHNPKKNNNEYIKNMIKNIRNNKKYDIIYKNITINNESTNKNNNNNNIGRKAISSSIAPTIMKKNKYNLIMVQREKMKKILIYNLKKSIKLDNIGTISYASYFESDILKLLSYLNQFDINDIKIVSHSALMKKFLNQKIIGDKKKIDDELKIVEKKENMWSIILNEGGICITRHAFTIANLYKEEGQKMNQFFDKDTTLSLYGILGALDFNNPEHINLTNCNNTVFVSILVRTWITALCLYLPKIQINKNNQQNKFTLVVSPFIKEVTKYIGIIRNTDDNLPIPINKQIIIIKNFLKFLREKISSNSESPLEQYIQSSNIIRDFFDSNGILEIYGVKEMKDKKFKYIKYEISYDSNNNCYVSTNKKENYFGSIVQLKPLQESTPTCFPIFGCKKKSEELEITKLQILPGVRKPETGLNISKEPLSKVKVNTFKNCMSNIKIGVIDIDEEGKTFIKNKIVDFYNNNIDFFKSLNILVVCTQRSLSQGKTQHFQHLLKEVIEENNNTNFNFKNSNKKNTTQVIPFKSFSAISGSGYGLRTRVYTQGLDNDKLDVKFNSVDFRYHSNIFLSTSSNQGAILCTIKYDDIDLVVQDMTKKNNSMSIVENNKELKVLNSFIGKGNNFNRILDDYFRNGTSKEIIKISPDTIYTGTLKFKKFYSIEKQPVLKNITYMNYKDMT